MIDILEHATAQDIALANALGLDKTVVEVDSLHSMRLEMHKKAFSMQSKQVTISQKTADELNKRLQLIVQNLEEKSDYNQMEDYMIDFNCFVKENPAYLCFSW